MCSGQPMVNWQRSTLSLLFDVLYLIKLHYRPGCWGMLLQAIKEKFFIKSVKM
jgi:hypothetical protein